MVFITFDFGESSREASQGSMQPEIKRFLAVEQLSNMSELTEANRTKLTNNLIYTATAVHLVNILCC